MSQSYYASAAVSQVLGHLHYRVWAVIGKEKHHVTCLTRKAASVPETSQNYRSIVAGFRGSLREYN